VSGPVASSYKSRTVDLLMPMLSRLDETPRVLDFGAGDGWIAHELEARGVGPQIECVDVVRRPDSFADVQVYDGERLPFEDQSWDRG
jgi:methylase of polypeptide subunit release factors